MAGKSAVAACIRYRWVLFLCTLIATAAACLYVLLAGQVYDASTWLGPSDAAVLRSVNAGNPAAPTAVTDETRAAETNRITSEIVAPDNVMRVVYGLAYVPHIRAALEDKARQPINDLNLPPEYYATRSWVLSVTRQMDQREIASLEQSSSIPPSLWPEFVFLGSRMRYFNVPRELMRSGEISSTVSDLLQHTEAYTPGPRDVLLSVRNANPRLAEILADAITACYKDRYDRDLRASSARDLRFYQSQYDAARRRSRKSLEALARAQVVRVGDPVAQRTALLSAETQARLSEAALGEASKSLDAAREALVAADASGGLMVHTWAGPAGTNSRPETPARQGNTRRNMTLVVLSMPLGLFAGIVIAILLDYARRRRPVATAPAPEAIPATADREF